MKTPTTFPYKVESLSAWRGVIYKSVSRGRSYFKLVYLNGGGRKTLGFESIEAAMDGVSDLVRIHGKSDSDSLVLSGVEAAHVRQAQASLAELPTPRLREKFEESLETAERTSGVGVIRPCVSVGRLPPYPPNSRLAKRLRASARGLFSFPLQWVRPKAPRPRAANAPQRAADGAPP